MGKDIGKQIFDFLCDFYTFLKTFQFENIDTENLQPAFYLVVKFVRGM